MKGQLAQAIHTGMLLIGISLPLHVSKASLFTVDSSYDSGTYTYSFTDGTWPIAFGLSQNSGSIYFNVSEVTNLVIPADWMVDYHEEGFSLSYLGALPIYPVGYLPLEITFDSPLTPDDVDTEDPFLGPLSGVVTGLLVLDNGQQASSQIDESGTIRTPVVGYQSFYFGGPDIYMGEVNAAVLAEIGLTPQDIVPVVSQISMTENTVCLKLDDIIGDVTYHVQYKPSLDAENWVYFRAFTSTELVDGCILLEDQDSPQGYFRVVIPE